MSQPQNPALPAEEVDRLERLLNGLIGMRITDNEKAFAAAVAEGRWSQVSGLHGIGTGLVLARRIIEEEFQSLRRAAAQSLPVSA